ncbi:zinc ribbon domain-containing protein [Desulfosarcina sp. OttesenSCG-928-A07]|nr:zinc ribbon domain-containing protein [Desulfosarcina sp. OttesenSCG-928-G17]MDL2328312.1 zinc ribbon domain-containing protein [Desulfosarcina sp. OttesenSCG-928-A07]
MPLYEYQCASCGKIEEAIQKFSDAPLTTCKYCSGNLNKLISHSSFHLKGTGWYVTDYSNKSKTGTHTANSSPGNEKTGSGDTSAGTASSATGGESAD